MSLKKKVKYFYTQHLDEECSLVINFILKVYIEGPSLIWKWKIKHNKK